MYLRFCFKPRRGEIIAPFGVVENQKTSYFYKNGIPSGLINALFLSIWFLMSLHCVNVYISPQRKKKAEFTGVFQIAASVYSFSIGGTATESGINRIHFYSFDAEPGAIIPSLHCAGTESCFINFIVRRLSQKPAAHQKSAGLVSINS